MWRFRKRRGVDTAIIGAVVTVIVAAVFLAIGTYVTSQIQGALPTPSDSTANETVTQVWNMTWVTFRILPIAILVLGASLILIVLIKGFTGGGGGGVVRYVVIRLSPRPSAEVI